MVQPSIHYNTQLPCLQNMQISAPGSIGDTEINKTAFKKFIVSKIALCSVSGTAGVNRSEWYARLGEGH